MNNRGLSLAAVGRNRKAPSIEDEVSTTSMELCSLLQVDRSLTQLSGNINWQEVIEQASLHDLSAFLYQRLKNLNPLQQLPKEVTGQLQQAYYRSTARGLRIQHHLAEALHAMRRFGIPVIPWKGAYLSEVVYGNPALRNMVDLDLLVRQQDLAAAAACLLELGYQPERAFYVDFEITCQSHLPTFSRPSSPPIELHWAFVVPDAPFQIDLDGVWQRARPMTLAGVPALALSAEDLILALCLHTAYKHRFNNGLKALLDLALVTGRLAEKISWHTVKQRAVAWSAELPVYLTLALSRELLGAAIPLKWLQEIKPADLDPAELELARRLVLRPPLVQTELSPDLAEWVQSESWRKKLQIALQRVFLPRRVMAQVYPVRPNSPLVFLYYPVRLCELARRYGYLALRGLGGDRQVKAKAAAVQEETHLRDSLFPGSKPNKPK